MTLIEGSQADQALILALNNANVPHVNELTAAELRDIVGMSAIYLVAASASGTIAGFCLALGEGMAYRSENYRWFCANMTGFIYIDRVAVDAACQGQGIGRELYAQAIARARAAGARHLVCEVNVEPPNPGSLAFHQKLGFREVGRLAHTHDAKVVAFLSLALTPATA